MAAHFPPPPPPAAVTRLLAAFDRETLASFITVAIDLIDLADGDADIEANGDEQDHNFAEDDHVDHVWSNGPGCPVSDPDLSVDDGSCDDRDIPS